MCVCVLLKLCDRVRVCENICIGACVSAFPLCVWYIWRLCVCVNLYDILWCVRGYCMGACMSVFPCVRVFLDVVACTCEFV